MKKQLLDNNCDKLYEGYLKKSPPYKSKSIFSIITKLNCTRNDGDVISHKRWRKRYFVLIKTIVEPKQIKLLYFRNKSAIEAKSLGTVNLDNMTSMEISADYKTNRPHTFSITTKDEKNRDRVYYLCAETGDSMLAWVDKITQALNINTTLNSNTAQSTFPLSRSSSKMNQSTLSSPKSAHMTRSNKSLDFINLSPHPSSASYHKAHFSAESNPPINSYYNVYPKNSNTNLPNSNTNQLNFDDELEEPMCIVDDVYKLPTELDEQPTTHAYINLKEENLSKSPLSNDHDPDIYFNHEPPIPMRNNNNNNNYFNTEHISSSINVTPIKSKSNDDNNDVNDNIYNNQNETLTVTPKDINSTYFFPKESSNDSKKQNSPLKIEYKNILMKKDETVKESKEDIHEFDFPLPTRIRSNSTSSTDSSTTASTESSEASQESVYNDHQENEITNKNSTLTSTKPDLSKPPLVPKRLTTSIPNNTNYSNIDFISPIPPPLPPPTSLSSLSTSNNDSLLPTKPPKLPQSNNNITNNQNKDISLNYIEHDCLDLPIDSNIHVDNTNNDDDPAITSSSLLIQNDDNSINSSNLSTYNNEQHIITNNNNSSLQPSVEYKEIVISKTEAIQKLKNRLQNE